jgi:hypothetical protein
MDDGRSMVVYEWRIGKKCENEAMGIGTGKEDGKGVIERKVYLGWE